MRLFSPRFEVRSIRKGVDRELVDFSGTTVAWYVYDSAGSTVDPVYDWHTDGVWKQPVTLRAVDVVEFEGPQQYQEQGLYTRNRIKAVFVSDELDRWGIDVWDNEAVHLKDRFIYDGRVFTPNDFVTGGEIREQGTIVAVNAIQVRPDELVNDSTFAAYSA